MRPEWTPMSSPQPLEHSTHADGTQFTSAAGTPSSRYSSTRTGHAVPAGCGVRVPQMSAIRSVIGVSFDVPTWCPSELGPHPWLRGNLLDLLEQAAVDRDLPLAPAPEREHRPPERVLELGR